MSAIILTHNHPDHIDADSLKKIIENNPNAGVLANAEIVKKLGEKDIIAEVFETGTRSIASFALEALDAPHEAILADETPQNTAYIIDDQILHPGDSLSKNLYAKRSTAVLCLPLMAPWETELQTYEFAKQMSPQTVVPVHDGYAKDFFLESRYQNFQNIWRKKISNFNG